MTSSIKFLFGVITSIQMRKLRGFKTMSFIKEEKEEEEEVEENNKKQKRKEEKEIIFLEPSVNLN